MAIGDLLMPVLVAAGIIAVALHWAWSMGEALRRRRRAEPPDEPPTPPDGDGPA